MIGKVVCTLLLLFWSLFAFVCFTNRLPQQPRLSIKVVRTELWHNSAQSDVALLESFAPLVKGHFPSGIPDAIRLTVSVDKDVAQEWRLDQAQIYPVTPSGQTDLELKQDAAITGGPTDFVLTFSALPEMDRGRLRLILIAHSDELESAVSEPDPEKKKQTLDALRPVWEAKAKDTKRRLDAQGGITVTPTSLQKTLPSHND